MKIKLLDAALLLDASLRAAHHPQIGHLDAEHSLSELRRILQIKLEFPDEVVESGVYSCRMLAEEGLFQHPDSLSLDTFILNMTPKGWVYNKEYSIFEEKMGDWHK